MGNTVYSACQWGMISVLAKLGNATVVGCFALGLAITAPVFMFTNLQLRAVQATDARSEFAFSDYFSLRLLASLAGFSTICLIALTGKYAPSTGGVIVLVGLSKAIESLGDVIAGLLQKAERLSRVSTSLMLRGGFSLPAFAAAFWYSRSLIAAMAALIAVWLSVFLIYDLRQARALLEDRDGFLAFRWPRLKSLAVVSAPLGIVMTLISLNTNIPRYLLERYVGTAGLGVFASLAYMIVVSNLVVNAVCQSTTTRLSFLFLETRLEEFCRLLFKLCIFGVIIIVVGVPVSLLCGRGLLTILYRPEYGNYVVTLAILVAAAGTSSTSFFITSGLNSARCFRAQLPVFVASTGATLLGCLALIPKYRLNGAATALLLSAIVGLLGNLWVLRLKVRSANRRIVTQLYCTAHDPA